MIERPLALLAALAGFSALVFQLERRPAFAPVFRHLPPIFWVYVLPMIATSLGLLPEASPVYGALTHTLLPTSLVLLLLSSDLPAIVRLGGKAVATMVASVAGISLGAVVAFLLFRSALGPEGWKGLAALTGTWTGGSVNLLAVSTALGLSASAQGVAIVVDTIVGYSWMAVLVALSARQAAMDRRLGADRKLVAEVGERVAERLERDRRPTSVADATLVLGIALVVAAAATELGDRLPPLGSVIGPFAWTIILVTTVGLLLSLTPLARLDGAGASVLGYAGFYLLMAAVGAQANLARIVSQPLWAAAGLVMILCHALVLLVALRLLRAPSFFFGAASQAAIGGYSSAPIVAEIYQAGLAPVGLLMAVLGNVLGTYLGLAVGQLLAWMAG